MQAPTEITFEWINQQTSYAHRKLKELNASIATARQAKNNAVRFRKLGYSAAILKSKSMPELSSGELRKAYATDAISELMEAENKAQDAFIALTDERRRYKDLLGDLKEMGYNLRCEMRMN